MYRPLIFISLCLFLAPENPEAPTTDVPLAPAADKQEPLPTGDAITFLEKCLERYDKDDIKGYAATFQKQERIAGKLQPSERTEISFRSKPFSVFMRWDKGARRAKAVLYVDGENNDKMIVRPTGIGGALVKYVQRDVDGEEARQGGRYTLKQFGMKRAMERTLRDWKVIRDKGQLQVEYLGVRKVHEAGDKLCYAIRRTCPTPEDEGLREVTIYIDKDSWLQVGSVLKGEDNKLIGEYFFKDIRINPEFKADQFLPEAVTQ